VTSPVAERRPEPVGELRVAVRPPFAADRLLAFLSARAVPGIEHVSAQTYRRSVRTASGAGCRLELTVDPAGPAVLLSVTGTDAAGWEPAGLVEAAVRLFDLDADPRAIDASLLADPALAPLVSATPGTRIPGAVDGFELAVRAIVGQQVSVAGARTTLGRIVARLGTPLEGAGPLTHLFPTPGAVSAASREDLPMPAARAAAIRELARRVDAGELDLSAGADIQAARAGLGAIPGVGPWTVGYVAMRGLRDPDAFPTGDLGVRHGIAALGLADDTRSIAARAERWRPWRAYAVMHLWLRDA
jgi:AraC family transcriptional regulator, regulatory protein of adaptative response / DNA-3-methyladenine glycosylase II